MQVVLNGYLGLSVLAGLNRHRLFVLGPIIVGLLAGASRGLPSFSTDGPIRRNRPRKTFLASLRRPASEAFDNPGQSR